MTTIRAVAPFVHPNSINFKTAPYETWLKVGGSVAASHYPPRALHGAALDSIQKKCQTASYVRLRKVICECFMQR